MVLRAEQDGADGSGHIVEWHSVAKAVDLGERFDREEADRDVGDDKDDHEEGDTTGGEERGHGLERKSDGEHAEVIDHPENEETAVTKLARKVDLEGEGEKRVEGGEEKVGDERRGEPEPDESTKRQVFLQS